LFEVAHALIEAVRFAVTFLADQDSDAVGIRRKKLRCSVRRCVDINEDFAVTEAGFEFQEVGNLPGDNPLFVKG